jgi:glycosyltransferase involved in cell wall biosynthesis
MKTMTMKSVSEDSSFASSKQTPHANEQVADIENDILKTPNPVSSLVIEGTAANHAIDNIDQHKVIEKRVKIIADILSIHDSRAWFLAAFFNSDYYQKTYGLEKIHNSDLFLHFMETGAALNYSPSPAYDPIYANKLLEAEHSESGEQHESEPNFFTWLQEAFDTIVPHALFNKTTYLDLYPDLAGLISNPYAHFAVHGLYENRISCTFLQQCANHVHRDFPDTEINLEAFFGSIPVGHSEIFANHETQVTLKNIFMPELYSAIISAAEDVSEESLYAHFLLHGVRSGNRPCVLFHEQWYLDQLAKHETRIRSRDLVADFQDVHPDELESLKNMGASASFFHWFFKGIKLGIVCSPLFDTNQYLYSHADILNRWKKHPFLHFIETGVKEPYRKFSPFFDSSHYIKNAGALVHNSALLDYVLESNNTGMPTVPGLMLDDFAYNESFNSSTIEEAAIFFLNRTSKLKSGVLADMVEKATELEPQIVRPYGATQIRMAPVFHPSSEALNDSRAIVSKLPGTQYDNIILIPHCRLAGSANVAGQFTSTLATLLSTESVLVITTDLAAFDRPDWFPEDVHLFDLSEHLIDRSQEHKITLLLDIIRGLRPKRIYNINSNLAWHLTKSFGKQLSVWMEIFIYLFCWDRDAKGNKGGYPIQWFLPTFDYCTRVFTDNTVLRDELRDRYCLTDTQRKKIVTLHTPAAEHDISYTAALGSRVNTTSVRRIFWSGRFDRQKRLDVLFAVASRLPDIEFWVWGKAVLNDSKVLSDAAPSNVQLMGTYSSLDDLPLASCDLFLYTSGWDGLPIILIDVASRGIPIVASEVGGISDLISSRTAWPIKDYANPDAYCDAISDVLDNYSVALEKASKCSDHAKELCSQQRYFANLRSAVLDSEKQTHKATN